ncbi:MAG UNVERIFIED_CONTAM: hypothetical protein LVT10_05990 [Anaerolineae bacterium]|jgi:hypothetical protein
MKRFALALFIVALLPWIAQAQDSTLTDLITAPQRSDSIRPTYPLRGYTASMPNRAQPSPAR